MPNGLSIFSCVVSLPLRYALAFGYEGDSKENDVEAAKLEFKERIALMEEPFDEIDGPEDDEEPTTTTTTSTTTTTTAAPVEDSVQVEETEDVEEGNAFGAARAEAIAKGEDTFKVGAPSTA